MIGRIPFLASILSCTALAAGPAMAASPLALLPAALLFGAQPAKPVACGMSGGSFAASSASASKAAALLGGAPSALEQMRTQQGTAVMAPAAGPCAAAPENANLAFARPAFAPPAPPLAPAFLPAPARAVPGEFLASRRLAIAHTSFDGQWDRVSHAALNEGAVRRLGIAQADGSVEARLRAVNTWANGHVRYAEDQALFGRADYWADAGETLRRGAGDCEDIAILKLQLLAASGIRREDMFLTIARDLVRHADHALLIVKDGERFWMLDNATDALVDAAPAVDYRPVFSFGEKGKWLHGYASRLAPVQVAMAPAPGPAPAVTEPLLSARLADAPAITAPALDIASLSAPDLPVRAAPLLAINAL